MEVVDILDGCMDGEPDNTVSTDFILGEPPQLSVAHFVPFDPQPFEPAASENDEDGDFILECLTDKAAAEIDLARRQRAWSDHAR